MSDVALRPRSAPELIDAVFQLYRRHFVPLVTLSAIVNIPLFIIQAVYAYFTDTMRSAQPSPGVLLSLMLLAGFQLIWYGIMDCTIVIGASERYTGGQIEPMVALRRALGRIGSVTGASILKWIILFAATTVASMVVAIPAVISGSLALMLFLIPVFPVVMGYFFARYFAVPAIVVLESIRATEALQRSWVLSQGRVWKIIGTLLLAWLIFFIALVPFGVVAFLLKGLMKIPAQVASSLASMVVYPVVAMTGMLLYYDSRVVKEGLDIELMTRELERGAAAAAPAPAP
jgi:hypothetical protein